MADTSLIPVKSSNLEAVRYDDAVKSLTVKFKDGGIYRYDDVPAKVFSDFFSADSLGGFLAAKIKPVYKVTKIEN